MARTGMMVGMNGQLRVVVILYCEELKRAQ